MLIEKINEVIIYITTKVLTIAGVESTPAIVKKLSQDILVPESYLPTAIKLATLIIAVLLLAEYLYKKKIYPKHAAWTYIFTVYIVVLMGMTYFSREPGSSSDILSWDMFRAFHKGVEDKAYFIENIMMTIPFGLLLPKVLPIAKKGRICLATGILLSIAIESHST